jgi:hypothetical protein
MIAVAVVALMEWGSRSIVGFVVGRPTTPMSVGRADQLFRKGLHPGQSREHVEAWLAAHGIPYDVLHRRDDVTFKGWWMDCRGNQTVAECAGLGVDSVFSVIRVSYPDADRFLLGRTQITVYLFFDGEDRLLRHWVDEFNLMP